MTDADRELAQAERLDYRAQGGLGKKYGLRELHVNPENPNEILGSAKAIPFYTYNRFATPANHGERIGELSEVSGVAMAVITTDNRLIIQHRVTTHVDILSGKTKNGNGSYMDIPGASVAGQNDASMPKTRAERRSGGAPNDLTNDVVNATIVGEATDEIGLKAADLTDQRIVGIAHDNVKPHDEILLLATTALTIDEVRIRAKSASENQELGAADIAEKFTDIEATPEAIMTLLTEVRCPLPPTHAAVYASCGYSLMLERGSKEAADEWFVTLQHAVARNYAAMDATVTKFYQTHPEAAGTVPERLWNKRIPERNLTGYSPSYTPSEQGLPNFEDELVRTGLKPETRREAQEVLIFDVDGVLTHPEKKRVMDETLYDELIDRLRSNQPVTLNTGRSLEWLQQNILTPLLGRIDGTDDIDKVAILRNLLVVGEKGGTWGTYDNTGAFVTNASEKLVIPEILKERARELIDQKYAESMFYDETKLTMLSVEMRDGFDQPTFATIQAEFVKDLQRILQETGNDKTYRVDPTTIATDVESPNVSKALGVRRLLDFLDARDFSYRSADFIGFGDSMSDVAMTDELSRQGMSNITFVYVGKPTDKPLTTKAYNVVQIPGYDQAALEFLKNI